METPDELQSTLHELDQALEQQRFEASGMARAMLDRLDPSVRESIPARGLADALDALDFDAAREQLAALRDALTEEVTP